MPALRKRTASACRWRRPRADGRGRGGSRGSRGSRGRDSARNSGTNTATKPGRFVGKIARACAVGESGAGPSWGSSIRAAPGRDRGVRHAAAYNGGARRAAWRGRRAPARSAGRTLVASPFEQPPQHGVTAAARPHHLLEHQLRRARLRHGPGGVAGARPTPAARRPVTGAGAPRGGGRGVTRGGRDRSRVVDCVVGGKARCWGVRRRGRRLGMGPRW